MNREEGRKDKQESHREAGRLQGGRRVVGTGKRVAGTDKSIAGTDRGVAGRQEGCNDQAGRL